jgi:hypothetical protein
VYPTYRIAALSCALLFAATGCGGKQVDTSMPSSEAQLLNSEITSAYVRTRDLLDEASTTAESFSQLPAGIDAGDFDVALLREVAESCFNEPVTLDDAQRLSEPPTRIEPALGPDIRPLTERPPVGRAIACNPARMLALETYLDAVAPEIRALITERILAADALRVMLGDVLVVRIDDLDEQRLAAVAELEELRAVSTERLATAQTADIDENQRRQAEVDYEAVTATLDEVEAVIEQIEAEWDAMRQLRRELIDVSAQSIARLGMN